jgi:hypothetical protein
MKVRLVLPNGEMESYEMKGPLMPIVKIPRVSRPEDNTEYAFALDTLRLDEFASAANGIPTYTFTPQPPAVVQEWLQ